MDWISVLFKLSCPIIIRNLKLFRSCKTEYPKKNWTLQSSGRPCINIAKKQRKNFGQILSWRFILFCSPYLKMGSITPRGSWSVRTALKREMLGRGKRTRSQGCLRNKTASKVSWVICTKVRCTIKFYMKFKIWPGRLPNKFIIRIKVLRFNFMPSYSSTWRKCCRLRPWNTRRLLKQSNLWYLYR